MYTFSFQCIIDESIVQRSTMDTNKAKSICALYSSRSLLHHFLLILKVTSKLFPFPSDVCLWTHVFLSDIEGLLLMNIIASVCSTCFRWKWRPRTESSSQSVFIVTGYWLWHFHTKDNWFFTTLRSNQWKRYSWGRIKLDFFGSKIIYQIIMTSFKHNYRLVTSKSY